MGRMPTVAPIGYLNTKLATRGENKIIVDPERFSIVRRMWDLMLTGNYSAPKVRDIATEKWGLLTLKKKKIGGTRIGYTSIYNMFSNLFYTGHFMYRGRTYKGDHTPMITMAEFDRVQSLIKEKGNPRPKTHEFAYGCGTLKCGECNYSIVGIDKIKYIKSEQITREYTFYLCTNRGKVTTCGQKDNVNEKEIEEQIEEKIRKYKIDPDFLLWSLEVMKDNDLVETKTDEDVKDNLARTLDSKQEELKKLIQMATKGFISDEEFKETRAELDGNINSLKSQMTESDSEKDKDLMELTEVAFYYSTYALVALHNGDKQTKKEIVKSFGLNRTLKDKKLSITAFEWYHEIQKGYFEIKKILARAEPELSCKQTMVSDFPTLRLMLRGGPDLNRQPLA